MMHRVYFTPGMFGFGRLASYDYFAHVERALTERLHAAGEQIETYVTDVSPTASIRRRAAALAELVARTCQGDGSDHGPNHLVGHSTGGLDARVVASPDAALPVGPEAVSWIPRLASVTTMNTPHFGTPLASFFTTVSGQRMLYALSALTFVGLSLGAPPLAAASALVVAFGRLDRALGMELRVLSRTTESLLRVLDDARSREVRAYLDAIMQDQGAMVQVMPEAMDLFVAGIGNRPGVLYQSTASMAPPPSPGLFVNSLLRPWSSLSSSIFAMLYGVTSRYDERYPCAAPTAGADNESFLERTFGRAPGVRANDGVVPFRSQIWGELVWAGLADHLDVLGHFRDQRDPSERGVASGEPPHVDWLSSGSTFDHGRFAALMDTISAGMLRAVRG